MELQPSRRILEELVHICQGFVILCTVHKHMQGISDGPKTSESLPNLPRKPSASCSWVGCRQILSDRRGIQTTGQGFIEGSFKTARPAKGIC